MKKINGNIIRANKIMNSLLDKRNYKIKNSRHFYDTLMIMTNKKLVNPFKIRHLRVQL